MMAAAILLIGVLATVALVDQANGATVAHKQREAATNLARQVVENAGAVSYDDVTPSKLVPALQGRPGLASSSPAPAYTVARGGVTYNVDIQVCDVDDQDDGLGSHAPDADGTPFCSDSLPEGTTDTKPADYRRVTATVTWTMDGQTATVRQSSFVMPPTGSDLPAVTTLTSNPTSPIVPSGSGCPSQVGFTATTSSIPAAVSWSVNGTQMGDASGSGTSWSFTWPISGLVDGDYVIGARARTGGGSYGPLTSATIRLNCSPPAAPQNFVAGQNARGSVDTEWLANKEHDIIGYRVYRQQTAPTAGTPQLVDCGSGTTPVSTTGTTCTDANPLASNGISWVGSTQQSSESSTISVSRPYYAVANDVLIATVAASTGSPITAPSGWKPIQDVTSTAGGLGIRYVSYYRVIPSGTEASSYSWTVGTGRSSSASITAWRGVNPTTPIGVSAQQTGGPTNGAVETSPSVTTTSPNALVVRAFAHGGPSGMTLSTPAGYTLTSWARSNATIHAQDTASQATPGPTGAATSTCSTSCTQWAAQTIALKPNLAADYWVTAVDLDANGNPREGPPSNVVHAYVVNTPPTAPSGLAGTASADGSNVVNWTTQGTDPDPGDSVAFYRVYRDGVRFDRTNSGTDTSWADPRPGSGTHTYYLTAVDTHLAESPPSASVTITQP